MRTRESIGSPCSNNKKKLIDSSSHIFSSSYSVNAMASNSIIKASEDTQEASEKSLMSHVSNDKVGNNLNWISKIYLFIVLQLVIGLVTDHAMAGFQIKPIIMKKRIALVIMATPNGILRPLQLRPTIMSAPTSKIYGRKPKP